MKKYLMQAVRRFSTVAEMPPCNFKPKKYTGPSYEDVMNIRKTNIHPSLFTAYSNPLFLTQGYMQYLFDNEGKRYLDMFGGIATVSVGHCHPVVVRTAYEQMQTCWHTSNIYLHPKIHEYAAKLVKRLPDNLSVCYFTNSGSEANDLAMMMARRHTGNFDMISLRNSYHGSSPYTLGLTGNSKWKQNFANGFGVHHIMNPDVYRGIWGGKYCRDSLVQTDRKCGCDVDNCAANQEYINELNEFLLYSTPSQKVAAFIVEPIQGIGGIVQYPKNYLKSAFDIIRKNGGLCIADEVQTGFGRTGDHFWGFQNHDVSPDIVTMAKGIANGFPMAAVVTTPEIAKSLQAAKHFNTFGGNPLGCSVALAVLDVIETEGLQENSRRVGTHLINKLAELQKEFEIVGDVRGKGLMIGMEFVTDKKSKTPLASNKMGKIWDKCRELGLIVGRGGFYDNVFRIQPPMCINIEDADFCADVLRNALSTLEKNSQ